MGLGTKTFFVAFLLCLSQIGVVGVADHEAIVTRVFSKYVSVTRRLQTLYRLEPAGSHGVWGLDDYYFLSFYWCVQKDQYSSLVCSSILFAGVRHN
jgi:serine/threonine-protein phosphatase 2A activator